MSLLKTQTNANACKCQDHTSTGSMHLSVIPAATDIRERQLYDESIQRQHAQRLNDLFFPTLQHVNAHQHGNGYHAHPEQPAKVAHINQLHDQMEQSGLVARLTIRPGGDHNASNVALTREHVNDLVAHGVADLKIPCTDNMVRLHSTRTGRITGVEYLPL